MITHSKGVDMELKRYALGTDNYGSFFYLFVKLIICSAADEILVSDGHKQPIKRKDFQLKGKNLNNC